VINPPEWNRIQISAMKAGVEWVASRGCGRGSVAGVLN